MMKKVGVLKNQYLAELKINCDQFTYSIQNIDKNKFHKNRPINFQVIEQNPRFVSYQVANYLCFTIDSQNYNRKGNEPDWVKKIIYNIEKKKITKRINLTKICQIKNLLITPLSYLKTAM